MILRVNSTFLELTGHQREELVGRRRFADLLTVGGKIYHETHYAPMLRMQGRAREIALDIVRADGERLPVLINSVYEPHGASGSPVVRTAIFEATQRREYEMELLRAKTKAEESELQARSLAETLQQTLIPPALPSVPGLELVASYRPAGAGNEVGGDFYDVFEIGEDDWVVVVGDVMGKGVEAAVVTALARYSLRAAAVRYSKPSRALEAVNELLFRDRTERFCTVVMLRARRVGDRWSVLLSSGGHPLPYLIRSGGEPEMVGRPGLLLGAFACSKPGDFAVELAPGDQMILYTDGVLEARRGNDFFGESRLQQALVQYASQPDQLAYSLTRDLVVFESDFTSDDIVIVTLRVPTG